MSTIEGRVFDGPRPLVPISPLLRGDAGKCPSTWQDQKHLPAWLCARREGHGGRHYAAGSISRQVYAIWGEVS